MTGSPPGLMLTPKTSSVSQLHNILCSVLLASNIHLTCSSGNSYMFFKPFEVFLYIFRNLHFLCLYSPESLNRKSFCCGCHPFCYFRLLHFLKKYWSFSFEVLSDQESAFRCRRRGSLSLNRWFGNMPWSRKWQPAPVLLPGELHGQQCLMGYSPWGHKKSDKTEHTHRQR